MGDLRILYRLESPVVFENLKTVFSRRSFDDITGELQEVWKLPHFHRAESLGALIAPSFLVDRGDFTDFSSPRSTREQVESQLVLAFSMNTAEYRFLLEYAERTLALANQRDQHARIFAEYVGVVHGHSGLLDTTDRYRKQLSALVGISYGRAELGSMIHALQVQRSSSTAQERSMR